MPEISVIIPTHNRWSLLRRTLAGALGQEDVDLEVVVVDDGSSDGTSERLEALGEPRLRIFRNETPLRVAGARNVGLENAHGEWLAYLDDDDVWAPDKLSRQLQAAKAAGAPFVYTSSALVDPELNVLAAQAAPDPAAILDENLSYCAIPGGCSNVIARAELFHATGGFATDLAVGEDWDMWIRLLLACDGKAASVDDYLYGYIQHASSSIIKNRSLVSQDYERIEERYAEARRERGVEVDNVALRRWLAGNHRRAGDRWGAAKIYLQSAWRDRNLGNVARAAALPFGESAIRRFSPREAPVLESAESWLPLYRPGGRLESVSAPETDPA